MADLPALIRTERLALIDLLETLEPEQWSTPSLCGGWTVQDVAAHLASAPVLTPVAATIELARAGFRPNRFIADSAVRFARRGTDEILRQLRENAATDAKPMGMPRVAALVDAVVHALDIRRPLGRPRPVPPEAFVAIADFCAGTRWPASAVVGGDVQGRVAGLRLVADDAGWAHGSGPEVRGSGETLALVLTGRPIGPAELTGPGAATLYARL
jgi:uncharacterized protein (TIGR03083 family)